MFVSLSFFGLTEPKMKKRKHLLKKSTTKKNQDLVKYGIQLNEKDNDNISQPQILVSPEVSDFL